MAGAINRTKARRTGSRVVDKAWGAHQLKSALLAVGQDFVECYDPSGIVVTKQQQSVIPGVSTTAYGPGVDGTGFGTSIYVRGLNQNVVTFSRVAVIRMDNISNESLISTSHSTNDSGAAEFTVLSSALMIIAGQQTIVAQTSSSIGLAVNKTSIVGVTYSVSGGTYTIKFYIDGRFISTHTGPAPTFTKNGTGAMLSRQSSAVRFRGACNLHLSFDAALNESMMMSLTRDPYQVFNATEQPLSILAGGIVGITGVGGTATVGSVSNSRIISATGNSASATTDSIGKSIIVGITGVGGTATVGSVSNSRIISATGNSASASAGVVVYVSGNVTVAATSVVVSATVSSIVNTNLFSVGITGPPSNAAIGTLIPSQSIAISLTGNISSGATGNISTSQSISLAISGNSTSATVQDVSANEEDTLSVSGVTSAATVGSVSKSISKNITSSSTSATVGSVSPTQTISIAILGVSSNATVQDVSTNDTDIITITGNISSASIGSVTTSQSISIGLSGVGYTADIGNVSYSGAGSVTVALTGTVVSATLNTFSPYISKSVTGNLANGFVDDIIRNVTLEISGNNASGNLNSILVSTTTNITGNTANSTVNNAVENLIVGLSGVGSNAAVGSVTTITDGVIQLTGVSTNTNIGIVYTHTTIGISGVDSSANVGTTEVIIIVSGNDTVADVGIVSPSITDEAVTIEISSVSASGEINNVLPISSLSILNIKLASSIGKVYSLISSVSTDILDDKVEKIYMLTNSITQG